MANISYLNTADGITTQYLKAKGQGTNLDPFIPIRDVEDDPSQFIETQLTAPGTTTPRDAKGFQKLLFYVTIASINDSVDLRVEGSPDNVNWYPLTEDLIFTSNGSKVITFNYVVPLNWVRLNFVAESGGTSAVIDATTVIQ